MCIGVSGADNDDLGTVPDSLVNQLDSPYSSTAKYENTRKFWESPGFFIT